MQPTLELKKLIKEVLADENYSVFTDEAPKDADYPYIVVEMTKGSSESYPFVGILEVNVWDRHRTNSRAESIMDIVESKLRNEFFENDSVNFRAFDGDRQPLIDEDKSIKRVREKFMIRYAIKGEV